MRAWGLIAVVVGLGVLSACGGTAASAPPVTTTVTGPAVTVNGPTVTVTATPPVAVLEMVACSGQPAASRPTEIIIACGDGNSSLTEIKWTAWSPAGAKGTATAIQNDCKPNCADGHDVAYPATVNLFGTYPASNGRVLFAGLSENIGGSYDADFPEARQPFTEQLPTA